eukprot:scaffold120700_cov23-Tisochrysis_lutea.AAC.1
MMSCSCAAVVSAGTSSCGPVRSPSAVSNWAMSEPVGTTGLPVALPLAMSSGTPEVTPSLVHAASSSVRVAPGLGALPCCVTSCLSWEMLNCESGNADPPAVYPADAAGVDDSAIRRARRATERGAAPSWTRHTHTHAAGGLPRVLFWGGPLLDVRLARCCHWPLAARVRACGDGEVLFGVLRGEESDHDRDPGGLRVDPLLPLVRRPQVHRTPAAH